MYLLTVCLFTKILTFHVLFKHGIHWIVLLEIFLRFPPLTKTSTNMFLQRGEILNIIM